MNVICFGDSNTFGYDPRSYIGERYDASARWVDILADKTGWNIRNNGMNGREIPVRETVFAKSTDLLIIMLGTNDVLQRNDSNTISCRMEKFLRQLPFDGSSVLLIAPPPLQRGDWVQDDRVIAASEELGDAYRHLSDRMGILFADAGKWDIPLAFDGVHFTEDGHRRFAEKLLSIIETMSSH